MGRAGRVILDQDVSRAPEVGMFDVKSHLVRRQVDLAAPLDHFELDHHKQAMRKRQQTVWDAQPYPALNPGEMAIWDILADPFVQARFRFQCHLVPLRALLQFAWELRPRSAPPGPRTSA